MSKNIVLLIHGIRDEAYWNGPVKDGLTSFAEERHDLGDVEVLPIGYGIFNAIQFLLPIPWIRNSPVNEVYEKLKAVRLQNPTANISAICHSFGTYVVARILLKEFEVRFYRIVLVGSVLSRKFPWFVFSQDRVVEVLNEVGTRDIWPLMAKAFTWGYGIAGWLGFQQGVRVTDRYWHSGHGELLTKQHSHDEWAPFVFLGIKASDGHGNEKRPYWTHLLASGALKYFLLGTFALSIACVWPYTLKQEFNLNVPATAGMNDELPSVDDTSYSNVRIYKGGMFRLPSYAKAYFLRATTDRWGTDCLGNIDIILSKGPYFLDVSTFLEGWKNSLGNDMIFKLWLKGEFEKLIVKPGLGSDNMNASQAELLQYGLLKFIDDELIPALKDPGRLLVGGKYLEVDCTRPGNYNNKPDAIDAARRAFCKRVIGLGFLLFPYNRALGPYYGVDGEVGHRAPNSVEFPVPTATFGSLVALVCEPHGNKVGGMIDKHEFHSPDAIIDNKSSSHEFVRLMINDDYPRDNGDGFCDVTIVVVSKTTAFKYMWGRFIRPE